MACQFVTKLLFLIFLGVYTVILFVTWHSSSEIGRQHSSSVRFGRSRDQARVSAPGFGHHHLLAVTPPHSRVRSNATHQSQKTRRCKVASTFPRTQLMSFKSEIPVSGHFCHQLIIKGNSTLQHFVKESLKHWQNKIQDETFLHDLITNCTNTYKDFADSSYTSQDEESFPIAYEILIYYKKTRIQQYIRLLKNLYRPHNYYCIHIDRKSSPRWTKLVRGFASCFPNIVVTRKQIRVEYARSSILYAHFECFKELMAISRKWKYAISLHGTELPLTTNREIVTTLRNMNGSNVIARGTNNKDLTGEAKKWLTHKVRSTHNGRWVELTNTTLGPIPYDMTVYKSAASANSAFSHPFIQFILTNKKAMAFSRFLQNVHSGVEFFFSTMNNLPEAPGGFHLIENKANLPLVAQRDWTHVIMKHHYICKERKVVHDICIVSASDLPRLYEASYNKLWLFHNKYFMEYDHIVMDCMERVLLQRNYHEYIQDCQRGMVTREFIQPVSDISSHLHHHKVPLH